MYDRYIPRRLVTLVAGSRGAGKTLAALWFAREVSLQGGAVWCNTAEDALASVIRPRLEVAGANLSAIRVSSEPYRFPRDRELFEKAIIGHAEEGRPDDLVILDSLQRHVPRYQTALDAVEAMAGLAEIADDYDLAIIVVGDLLASLVPDASCCNWP